MPFCSTLHLPILVWLAVSGALAVADDTSVATPREGHPLSQAEQGTLRQDFEITLKSLPTPKPLADDAVRVHSRRGDALFFLGRFPEAVEQYKAMVQLDPAQDASHWRLGIALFFADQPKQAVAQFEKYHSFDDVDRENGIWRYLSQYKASDAQTAKKELLRYDKDDREPFPAVYRMFDGTLSPDEALAEIPAELPATERDKRLFYTELYIGMHMVVQEKPNKARRYLARAVARHWPRTAGYGPNFMWHVGRVQLEALLTEPAVQAADER